jgi:hypothetical protein
MSIQVKSIDDYGIKKRLKEQGDKEALQLIKALEEAYKRQQDLTKTAISKLKRYAEKYGNIE